VNRSTWVVLLFGIVAFLLLTIVMMLTLESFQQTPAGNQVKLALAVKEKFRLEAVLAYVAEENGRKQLRVKYQTRSDSKYEEAFQKKEMEEVGTFALSEYKLGDRKYLQDVAVHRIEVRGSGCWQNTLESRTTLPAPPPPPK